MNQELKRLWKLCLPHLEKANPDRANHTFRVLRFAEYLAEKEGADLEVVQFAAILHDIGKYKETDEEDHSVVSAKLAGPILKKFKLSDKKKENIIHCVRFHDPYIRVKVRTMEAKIIQDADIIDRLSPVKISQFFYFGALKGRSLTESLKRAERYVKNTYRPNTKTAKKMAERKKKFALGFLDEFDKDWAEAPK